MLLVIDVGNTNTVMGVYASGSLLVDWRIRTEIRTTEDEFYVLARGLFLAEGIKPKEISKTIISCVVPPMVSILEGFCRRFLVHSPVWVDAKTASGMPILYTNPMEVGADRIVNSVAAYEKYRTSLIVIDFGTATTFDVISEKGEYLGGAISPGLGISAEALYSHASKLPRVELFHPPEKAIGKDTGESIQSGILFGYAAMVDGMVERISAEMSSPPKVVATGGLAPLMEKLTKTIEEVDSRLTLEGLRLIYERIQE